MMTTQVALFGTSADPPTTGHQTVLQWLARHYDWVAVWASDNPFKSHAVPLEHRMAMLRVLIESTPDLRHNVELYPAFSHPRSIVTIERAQAQWPKAELSLVIGSDLAPQIPRWYQAEAIFQQAKLVIMPRPSYPLREADLQHLQALGAKLRVASLKSVPASSTAFREGCDVSNLLPQIQAYIHREQLYACQTNAPEKLKLR